MLREDLTSVLDVMSRDELRAEVIGFAHRLGFETVNAMVVIDHLGSESEFLRVDNTPPAYRYVFENRQAGLRDPVMQHCKRRGVPIIWNQQTYTSVGLGEKWEVQASFGYRAGITFALHLPRGRHFLVGVNRADSLPSDPAEVTRLVAELQLFAVHAQDAALRILAPESHETDAPSLTPREVESLRWTMEGKTAWELGCILGISEQTAARHVNNASQKLGCVNKLQAVVKALRLGLIH